MRKKISLLTIAFMLLPMLVLPVNAQQGKPEPQPSDKLRRLSKTSPPSRAQVEMAEPQEGNAERDADMNLRSGIDANLQRMDYLQRRGEMIAMLRGLPLPANVSPDARANAIRQMEQQEIQLRQRTAAGNAVT